MAEIESKGATAVQEAPTAVQEAPVAVQEAPAAVQEAPPAAVPEEDTFSIDVDVDSGMEWEVETEPAETQTYYQDAPYGQGGYTYQQGQYGQGGYPYQQRPYYRGGYTYQRPGVRVARRYNKHIFTWIYSMLLGMYGVDRFVRGQIGLGLLKIFTFGGFGMWYLVDLIIAIVKSYSGPTAMMEDVMFDSFGNYVY